MDLFAHPRLGLFMHWGLYSLGRWHEQEIWRWPVPKPEYVKRLSAWEPHAFDPGEWLDFAQDAGMDYLCITAKHIDGFCLWPSEQTEFSVSSAHDQLDIVGSLADECHMRGIGFCIYYSIPDMHHPAYPHAGNPYELDAPRDGEVADRAAYLSYVTAQVEELCTWYGAVDAFWWDANVQGWQLPEVNARIRELQPGIVINNRGFDSGDFATPERDWDQSVNTLPAFSTPTEACQSIGLYSWGAKQDEEHYTPLYLERSIAKVMAKGGNYLLNVGTEPDGSISQAARRIVAEIGDWFARVREAFTSAAPIQIAELPQRVLATASHRSLYLVWIRSPGTDGLLLRGLTAEPSKATILNTGEAARWVVDRLPGYGPGKEPTPAVRLVDLPAEVLNNQAAVVRLDFDLPVSEAVRAPSGASDSDGPPPEFMVGSDDG